MSVMEQYYDKSHLRHLLPPQVLTVWLVENGQTQVTQENWHEFGHLFKWVNHQVLRQHFLNLKRITLHGEISIIYVLAESEEIIADVRLQKHDLP